MTQLDVVYRYGAAPASAACLLSRRCGRLRRAPVEVREAEKTVRVEYDASRLTEAAIQKMLRRAGSTLWRRLKAVRGRGDCRRGL